MILLPTPGGLSNPTSAEAHVGPVAMPRVLLFWYGTGPMQTAIIEATQPGDHPFNWGKFLVMKPDKGEWRRTSAVSEAGMPLLAELGWATEHVMVFDLQIGEGAFFATWGSALHDLNKRKIHVCVLFEAFLDWLYDQDLRDLSTLPEKVEVECEPGVYGYRRDGLDLVGISEIAKMREFSKQRAQQLSKDPDFPEPAVVFEMGPAWWRWQVAEFFVNRYAKGAKRDLAAVRSVA